MKVKLYEILPGMNLPQEKLWNRRQTDGIPFIAGKSDAVKKMDSCVSLRDIFSFRRL